MAAMLATHGGSARVIVVRVLGGAAAVPGLGRLAETARANGQHLILVSGVGDPDPELTTASTVAPAVVHEAMAYLRAGGRENLGRLLRFLSDHLLMTGFGYEPPWEPPEHGIYHPDLPREATAAAWAASARSGPARGGDLVLSGPLAQRQSGLR